MTLYEALGVTEQATPAELKAAHREAVKAHHPDRGGDPADFVRVQRAYAILSDPDRRGRYDSTGVEDEPSAAEDQQACSTVAQLILQAIDGDGDLERTDVLAAVRSALQREEKTHLLARTRIEARLRRLELLQSKLRRNGPGEDVLAAPMAAKEAALAAAHTHEGEQLRILARALEVLSQYSYRLDPTPPEEAAIWSALKRGG